MMRFVLGIVLLIGAFGSSARAQSANDVVWVQIEAQPNFTQAQERVQVYASQLPDINGFTLQGGWFGIALGPYTPEDAEQVLRSYRAQGLIPRDSYIALSRTYRQQFWPEGADILSRGAAVVSLEGLASAPQQAAQADPIVTPQPDPDETPAQARRSENLLTRDEKRDLQTALKWAGFYNAAIDGSYGRGTRRAMSDWQGANGFEATGILTTTQRTALLGQYNAILDGLGMQRVSDLQAGIEMVLPTSVVDFARYEAPFAQYNATTDLPARVLLISQEGDRNTLQGLYDIMQTLEIVPLEGPRSISGNRFTLTGQNARIVSETRASLSGGQIKGFTLIWPANDEARRARVLEELESSFTRLDGVLNDNAGSSDTQQVDLIAGLQVRTPRLSRSGFFVNGSGAVVTTAEAVQSCTRITLDEQHNATVSGVDAERGIALLTPENPLAPPAIARFSAATPRLQSQVAVAGYSFEGQLGAASMTFGTLSDLKGLRGEPDLNRLALEALPGDAGGPVFDTSGNVFGMLLPRSQGARQLPEEVRFALTGQAISGLMSQAGFEQTEGQETASLAPEDITERGVGMTVLVSCWE